MSPSAPADARGRLDGAERAALEGLLRTLAAEVLGNGADGAAPIASLVSATASALAPEGAPPTDRAGAQSWRALLTALDRLYGSGVARLGRLECIDDARLDRLAAEARDSRPGDLSARVADPGQALRELAVDRRVRAALAKAIGRQVVPCYIAVYQFDRSGSHVPPHVDRQPFELTFHLVVSHRRPSGGADPSALVAYLPGRAPERVPLAAGEAVLLRGHGTLHRWEPLEPGEERTLTAVAFRPAP